MQGGASASGCWNMCACQSYGFFCFTLNACKQYVANLITDVHVMQERQGPCKPCIGLRYEVVAGNACRCCSQPCDTATSRLGAEPQMGPLWS